MTERYCKSCGGWHDLDRPWPDNCRPERIMARSDLPAPYTRSDGMSDTWNPVDGNYYDTRSGYERAVKQAGCEIVGNDKGYWNQAREPKAYKPDGVGQSVKDAWDQLSSR
jgi:hypothetical protein